MSTAAAVSANSELLDAYQVAFHPESAEQQRLKSFQEDCSVVQLVASLRRDLIDPGSIPRSIKILEHAKINIIHANVHQTK